MPRLFVYDGRTFPDPDSRLSVEDVRRQLADYFPELANADTREELRGEDTVYSFSRRIGTKERWPAQTPRWTSWKFCAAFVLATSRI
jgi:PRTRC genetic system protein C